MGGAAAVLLLGGLAWCLVKRRRAASVAPAGATMATHGHPHHAVGAAHVPSIVPHVKDRFDLTEIVEQTGGWARWVAHGATCWWLAALPPWTARRAGRPVLQPPLMHRLAPRTVPPPPAGSPYSARRRVKTAFQSDSPMRRGATPRGPF